MKLFNDTNLQQQYIENGYVITNLLNGQEVADLLSSLISFSPDDYFYPKNRNSSDYHCTFLDTNETYKRAANKLFKETFNPHVKKLMQDYHVWNANFYVKQPNAGKFEMHQNWTHVKEEHLTSFTIWCPLVDTTIENGTIQLVPKTHKILPDIATLNLPYYFSDIESYITEHEMIPVPLKTGQCVIFEDGVIHFSDINRSQYPRYAVQILIGPKYSKPVYYYYNPQEPQKGFEVFEIDDEFFMKNSYFSMTDRPQNQPSIGYIDNNNKLLTKDEYLLAKTNGEIRRKAIYNL